MARLQHVSSPFWPGGQDEVRQFYGRLLGFREIPVPATLDWSRLVWFAAGDGDLELHFFEGTPDPAHRRHLSLAVDDLEETHRRLETAGHAPFAAPPIHNRPRFYCRDPFGNLIEFTTILGSYEG